MAEKSLLSPPSLLKHASRNSRGKRMMGRAIHLYINPFSVITLGHAVGFVIEGTPSSPKASDLGPPFDVLWTIVEDPTLTLSTYLKLFN
ncbi:hypothetical protein PIB30_066762 [Stylosanthes scabra]|uniref:Uncharacterized protein n=1 Tax=Stylosanthes scabra TaxID=79078 RepID=A0ABU6XNV4_9FABA|nr:hypothetical protein [Stylosanthes scabra]